LDATDALLRGIFAMVGRTVFRPDARYKIIGPTAGSAKQVEAYNLCDGRTLQKDICKKAKLDPGSLSRSIAKWVEAGVVIRIGPDELPLHIYPLSA
jgi:DNA-binding MarR family transcriptional regulator